MWHPILEPRNALQSFLPSMSLQPLGQLFGHTRAWWFLLGLALLAGCAGAPKSQDQDTQDEDTQEIKNVVNQEERLYNQAQQQLDGNNFLAAIATLNQLLEAVPFGRFTEQAQLDLIYAHLRLLQTEEARLQAEKFLQANPQHVNSDYAFFMRALASYVNDIRATNRFFALDPARRDVSPVRVSFEELREFLQLYPESPYSPLARRRMLQLRDILAKHELLVATYYLRRRASIAAANRASWVLERISDTSYTPWALAVHVASFRQMSLGDREQNSLTILKEQFPDHPATATVSDSDVTVFDLPDREVTVTDILTAGIFRPPYQQKAQEKAPTSSER